MIYNTNRRKGAKFESPDFFMLRRKAREGGRPSAVQHADPAAPQSGARYALPGERPPSRRAAGQPDTTIQKFDAYMKAIQGTEVPKYAR